MRHELIFNGDKEKIDFLSRFFGIFNKEIVRFWLRDHNNSKYEDLGRSTIYNTKGEKIATLDFTLRNKATGQNYLAEQKYWFGFQNGNLTTISEENSFWVRFSKWSNKNYKSKPAWKVLIEKDKTNWIVKTQKIKTAISGSILIWADYNEAGKSRMISEYGFHDVVSLKEIVQDLKNWNNQDYIRYISGIKHWTEELLCDLSFIEPSFTDSQKQEITQLLNLLSKKIKSNGTKNLKFYRDFDYVFYCRYNDMDNKANIIHIKIDRCGNKTDRKKDYLFTERGQRSLFDSYDRFVEISEDDLQILLNN